jgi:CBS domain-containing protein
MKQVKDAMTSNPQVISSETTVAEAARQMRNLHTGSLLIGNAERLQGFITDRDIVVRLVAEGEDPESTEVGEIMTEKVLYCFEDDSISDCAGNMRQNEITRLVVLDRSKRLVGVITHGDLAQCVLRHNIQQEVGQAVSEIAAQHKAA